MSIVTLKRKTQTQYNNMSVSAPNGFSLNGTRRSQGYVGQTSLSRYLSRTLMNGNVPRGHGGCCGFYPKKPIVQSAVTSLNDPNVIKKSSINTNGLLETIKYQYGYNSNPTVKPDSNQHANDGGMYIDFIHKKTISDVNTCTALAVSLKTGITPLPGNKKPVAPGFICATPSYFSYNIGRNQINRSLCTRITKPEKTVSQGEYLATLDNQCELNDIKFVPHKSLIGGPLPGNY